MRLDSMEQLSVLACWTGLALALIWFAGLWTGTQTPFWLPPMISGVGGFELFMALRERTRRRGDGNG